LRDELAIILSSCPRPVIIIDDFDAGNGLSYDEYQDRKLAFDYLASSVPPDCEFFVNPWSNRNRGLIFIFPGAADYGCPFGDRVHYNEAKHGLRNKVSASPASRTEMAKRS
jgi:hypothetical protein